ncbi:hypothetical protein [Amycolatopsis eburnea]|uniref:Uncharacterized protein n=1 Tax=Amycolatopsis eburnea TaxID=2267691 RepID=A0A3R9DPL3_9PSEU|nr:hypothetical protein [Amycolatopsis eburnea]RSD07814.1 hypothetical protein EIY87_44295 [Amycolatopsis eburnea]
MPDNDLTGFPIIGAVIVLADGQVLYRGARRYLTGPDGGEETGSMAWPVVTVFHLVAFGVLALLSVVGPRWSGSAAALVGRLGVFLLLLAVVHVLTLAVLARGRQGRIVEAHYQEREAGGEVLAEPTVAPVPGQEGRHPEVSPDLGHHGPYRA